MNKNECRALFAEPDISHVERSLYLYLRMHMDYSTGEVGRSRRLSYQGIIEHLEVLPAIGSHDPAYRPSRDQVKRLLNKLVRRGLIQPAHTTTKGPAPMLFRLVLATADLVRPQEERPRSAQGAPRQNPHSARVLDFPAPQKTPEERHTSDLSDIEREIAHTREELVLDDDYVAVAKQVALLVEPDEITALFEQFRYAVDEPLVNRVKGQWLGQWRKYCAAVRANRLSKAKQSSGGQHATGKRFNPTSHSLDTAITAAHYNAEHGIDFSVLDEIAEITARDNTA